MHNSIKLIGIEKQGPRIHPNSAIITEGASECFWTRTSKKSMSVNWTTLLCGQTFKTLNARLWKFSFSSCFIHYYRSRTTFWWIMRVSPEEKNSVSAADHRWTTDGYGLSKIKHWSTAENEKPAHDIDAHQAAESHLCPRNDPSFVDRSRVGGYAVSNACRTMVEKALAVTAWTRVGVLVPSSHFLKAKSIVRCGACTEWMNVTFQLFLKPLLPLHSRVLFIRMQTIVQWGSLRWLQLAHSWVSTSNFARGKMMR